jgi:RimJ/RimL family protein N-acetyltransferase
MKDPDCRILIAEDGGKAVGQFRVDWRSAQDGEIDVSVSRDCRGRGYGARLIDLGVEVAGEGREDVQFHAFVRVENEASLRAFETAGFRSLGEEQVNGHLSVHYVRASLQNRALRSR